MKLRVFAMAWITSSVSAFAAPTLPPDVARLIERRQSCEHWLGEHGYDSERQQDINWGICQSCPGTDAELVRLKKKYRSNAEVQRKLLELAERVEPRNKEEGRKFCKSTRKPAWQN